MKEAPRRVRKEAASRPRGRFLPPVPLCAALCRSVPEGYASAGLAPLRRGPGRTGDAD